MIEFVFYVFLGSAAIQFLFFILVIMALTFYSKPALKDYKAAGISVIVCAKNEKENLKKLIPQLLAQSYDSFELILVDDRSTDGTYDYAIELKQTEEKFKFVRIDSTPDHINNKKYAITLGIRAARFDHLLLTDADCIPAGENWINEMSKGYNSESKNVVIGFSQYTAAPGFLNQFIKYETLLTAINYIGLGLLGNPYMAIGRNLGYNKSLFLKHNGFGKFQNVVGGDDDLFVNKHAKKKSTSFVLSPNAIVYSYPKTKISDFISQKIRHLSVGKHYSFTDKLVLGTLSLSKIVFWFSFFAAIMSVFQTYYVLGGFLLVMVSLLSALVILKKKTGDNSSIWMLPILDFIFIFYYISTGLKILFTKKVRWK